MKCPFGNSNSHASSSSKPSLPQIAFDGALSDVREGVHEAVLVVALRELDRVRGRRRRDAAALTLSVLRAGGVRLGVVVAGLGEGAFESRAFGGLAVRRQHDLHGLVEQRPQPGRHLLDRDAFR